MDTINCTLAANDSEYTEIYLQGLQDRSTLAMIPSLAMLALLALVGFLGNSLVLLVYSRRPRLNPTKMMLMTIAVFDLVANVGAIPSEINTMLHYWNFKDPAVCKVKVMLNAFPTLAGGMCLVFVAVIRYRKVCAPYGWQITRHQVKVFNLVTAGLSTLLSISYVAMYGRMSKPTPCAHILGYECYFSDSYKHTLWPLLHNGLFIVVYLLCVVPLVVMYILIGLEARRHFKVCQMYNDCPIDAANTRRASTVRSLKSGQSPIGATTALGSSLNKDERSPCATSAMPGPSIDKDGKSLCATSVMSEPYINKDAESLCETSAVSGSPIHKDIKSPGITSVVSGPSINRDVKSPYETFPMSRSPARKNMESPYPTSALSRISKSHDIVGPSRSSILTKTCNNFQDNCPTRDNFNERNTNVAFQTSVHQQFRTQSQDVCSSKLASSENLHLTAEDTSSEPTHCCNHKDNKTHVGKTMTHTYTSETGNTQIPPENNTPKRQKNNTKRTETPKRTNTPATRLLTLKQTRNNRIKTGNKSLSRMTAILIILSAVHVGSYLSFLMLSIYKNAAPSGFANLSAGQLSVFHVFLRLYFLNCAVNPIIYSVCDDNFRRSCVSLLSFR